MTDTQKPVQDPLVRQRIFPDPAQLFDFSPLGLNEALRDGIVVVDTNVLLVPYTTGRASLEQIRRCYACLTQDGRLRIPGQVVREFADNRAEKLKVLFQQLSRKRNFNFDRSEYPLLEGVPSYLELVKRESEISSVLSDYRKLIADLLKTVQDWRWDDPVSQIYRDLFKPPFIVDTEFQHEELLDDLKYRQENRIPPGYKDANNTYSGVGDLIIWKTILKLGELERRHLIFVSGEEKSDWRYQSEGQALYPRFELVDEYRRMSGGKSFLMISFAELLQQFGAPPTVVEEIKQEEAISALEEPRRQLSTAAAERAVAANKSIIKWLLAKHHDGTIEVDNRGFPDYGTYSGAWKGSF